MAAASLKSTLITQAIAITIFVGVPIGLTLMAPFSNLRFEKSGSASSVTVTRYVLIFIPWQIRRIDDVTRLRADVKDSFRYADTAENRRKGRAGAVSAATGQLVVVHAGPEVSVQAAPELADAAAARFERFRSEPDPAPVEVPLYASWWLSYVLGGVATAFAALYLVGAALAIVTYPFKKKRVGVPA